MLDPEFKVKWIEALESGEYHQGQCKLFDGKNYCCLGVAYTIAGNAFACTGPNFYTTGGNLNYLDPEDYGLTSDQQFRLANLNDEGQSFKEIADYIRNNL